MAVVCPTVTVETPSEYTQAITQASSYASRLHLDVADGLLAPRKLISPAQLYLPEDIICDIHVMYERPSEELMTLMSLRPHLVILHAEAKGDIASCLRALKKVGIQAGIALLPATTVESAAKLIALADHVLIFAGHLGYQGGEADMSQIEKVAEVKAINSSAEIAWDGGVNDQNAKQLVGSGIGVLNVGGFIRNAADPAAAYAAMQAAAGA